MGRSTSWLLWMTTQDLRVLCFSSSDDVMMFFLKMIQAKLSCFVGGIKSEHRTVFENAKLDVFSAEMVSNTTFQYLEHINKIGWWEG